MIYIEFVDVGKLSSKTLTRNMIYSRLYSFNQRILRKELFVRLVNLSEYVFRSSHWNEIKKSVVDKNKIHGRYSSIRI